MEKLNVNFLKAEGPVKALNGVNNGPLGTGNVRANGNFEAYKAAKFPFARLHDSATSFYGMRNVDVHRIFADFDRDVEDPAAYYFDDTDRYLQNITAAGTEVIYRLGACIEHEEKLGTKVPKSYEKWAKICEHIIRHVNEGWADGLHLGIRYWEIWNEPDCRNADGSNPCWQGTPEQFADFFEVVAKDLKAAFPELMIGGPAFCDMYTPVDEYYLSEFQKRNVKLDFISYHRYCYTVDNMVDYIRMSNALFEKYGYGNCEKHLNEWNYNHGWLGEDYKESIRTIQGVKGSSFVTGVLCAAQHEDIDVMNYYDARLNSGFNGIFGPYVYDPLKTYYSMMAFSALKECKTSYAVETSAGVYAAAAWDGKKGGLLLTFFDDDKAAPAKDLTLSLSGLSGNVKATLEILDKNYDLAPVKEVVLSGEEKKLELNLPVYTSYYILLEAID